jgi:hypothetical protein
MSLKSICAQSANSQTPFTADQQEKLKNAYYLAEGDMIARSARSPEARQRRAAKRRARKKDIQANISEKWDELQDRYLAGDVGELSDFELNILDTIHGKD